MKAAIYLRQSKTREGSESLDTQEEVCREALTRLGFEVVRVLREPPSTSGYKNRGRSRKKFKILLEGFRDGRWQMVMAYKTDRLSRGGGPGWAPLLEAIETAGLDLDRAVATPSGFLSEFEIGIRATMDREESKKLSERMHDVAGRKAAQGKPHGSRRPYGYMENQLDLCEPEVAVLHEMAERVLTGHSYKEVAYWLNECGVKTTEGKLWYPITVRNLLTRTRYVGVREYEGERYEGIWTPVFDPETWERLQLTIQLRKEAAGNVPRARRYLLTGIAHCGRCGMPLNGTTKRDNPKRPLRRTYQCRVTGDTQRTRGCGGVTRNADALEDWIERIIVGDLDSGRLLEILSVERPDALAIKHVIDERNAQRVRLDGLVDDYATGLLKRAQFERAKKTAESELLRLERDLTRLTSLHSVFGMLPEGKSVREAWDEEPEDWRRTLIATLIERIVVDPGITKPYYELLNGTVARFDPTLVTVEWRNLNQKLVS